MKKITASNYKKDKYYKKVAKAISQILAKNNYVSPIDVFIELGYLSKENYENWRFGRINYLEKAIECNLSKANRILRILNIHSKNMGLKPSFTGYKKYGKGMKILLRFSKYGDPNLETAYSTHYVSTYNKENNKIQKSDLNFT
jgi:hypothetical protein